MALPIRKTITDIQALCSYLRRKPTGASLTEARAVVEKKHLDGRKLSAFRFWRIIEDDGSKLKLTDRGRRVADDASRCGALGEVVHEVAPYMAVMERADTRKEQTISALDVATHWHEHFRDEAAGTDKILNDQALCFFQLAEGAELGKIVPVREYPIWTDVGSSGSWSARTEPVTDRESVADSLEMTTTETLLVVGVTLYVGSIGR